ncbi:MAG: hypothetical protein RIS70_4469, partial [Planctomycetota bacterium]
MLFQRRLTRRFIAAAAVLVSGLLMASTVAAQEPALNRAPPAIDPALSLGK